MARTRTQKVVSRRIDLSYIKRATPLRTGRIALAFITGALAIVAVTFLSIGGDARLHNPGPLTNAHASWQNNCAACHTGEDPKAPGGFAKTVPDAACLQCHDGARHNANQPLAALSTIDAAHATAKDCTACHTEHRGEALLTASNNQLCINCHNDLTGHTQKPPQTSSRVSAFTLADHPRFGRKLTADGKITENSKLIDPTVLKYNHQYHNDKQAILKDNCTACHSVNNYEVVTTKTTVKDAAPPFALDSDPVVNGQTRAHIEQISFERHCIGCHAIELPGPGTFRVAVPHKELNTVRGFLSNVGTEYLVTLNGSPNRNELLTEEKIGPAPARKKTKVAITEAAWLDARMKDLAKKVDQELGSDPTFKVIRPTAAPATQPAGPYTVSGIPNPNILELYVTKSLSNKCTKCHTVQGEVPALAYKPAIPTTAPSALASASPVLAFTTPTGVTANVRTWFSRTTSSIVPIAR